MLEYTNLPEITELLTYILYTDYLILNDIQKEVPLSALIVARAGGGKTAVIKQFGSSDGCKEIDNTTAWGITHKYLPDIEKGIIKRLIIPDMITPTNRKKATVDSTITILNALVSWEGVKEIYSYDTKISLSKPARATVLTCMATKDFERMVRSLAAVGFLRRFILIGYAYSKNEMRDILHNIARDKAHWADVKLNFPKTPVLVKMTATQKDEFTDVSFKIADKVNADPPGTFNQLCILCQGKALSQGRDVVTKDDVFRVLFLADKYIGDIPIDARFRRYLGDKVVKNEKE